LKIRNKTCPRRFSPWEEILLNPAKGVDGINIGSLLDEKSLQARMAYLKRNSINRSQLASFLESEQAGLSLSEKQHKHLEESKEPESLFIVTGQQPGALGGPVLWLYKALTAVSAAAELRKRFGVPVIPVFWIAGDDDDIEECGFIQAMRSDGESLVLPLAPPGQVSRTSLSLLPLGMGAAKAHTLLSNFWQNHTLEMAESLLCPEITFTESFRKLAQRILGPEGILFIDGFSSEFRRLSGPTLRQFIRDWKTLEDSLLHVNALLKNQGLKPQSEYRPGTVHAFLVSRGKRERIIAEGEAMVTAGRHPLGLDRAFSIGRDASVVSHDAITRALLIEALMPVAGHVLGPHEMGYFLQLCPLFEHYFNSVPLVFPRMKATVITRKQEEAFLNAGLQPDLLPSLKPSGLRRHLLQQGRERALPDKIRRLSPEAWLNGLENAQNRILEELPGSHAAFAGLKTRISRDWDHYLEDLNKAAYQKLAPRRARLESAMTWLGKGAGQDTQLNLFSLIELFGPGNLKHFLSALKPLSLEHQLLTLE
jgi:bacillithiol biosynthesis cysteine-adding enzyme BshC